MKTKESYRYDVQTKYGSVNNPQTGPPYTIVFLGELYSSKNGRKQRAFNHTDKKTGKTKMCLAPVKSDLAFKDELKIRDVIKNNALALMPLRAYLATARYPVRIRFLIYRKTHRRFDFINIIQNLCDCLVKERIIPDDDAKHLIPVFEPYKVDGANPRTELIFE